MTAKWQIIDEWMQKYGTQVTRVITGLTGDEEAGQDLAQETFIRAFHSLDSFRKESSPYTYLYRIACNLSMDYHREQKRRRRHETGAIDGGQDDAGSPFDNLPDPDGGSRPETKVVNHERIMEVRQALAALPHKYRETVVLFYLAGLGITEIGKITGAAEGTVKSRLFRARKNLEKRLSETGVIDRSGS